MFGAHTFMHPDFAGFPAGVDLGGLMVLPTGGKRVYVRSTGPADYDPPSLTGLIIPTLSKALLQCRANKADTVIVLPGHSESVTDNTMMDNLRAGTRIIGFGRGASMPVFRWTATTSQWILNDADVLIQGLRLRLEGANGVVKALAITGADNRIEGCDIEVASGATAKATIAIEAGSGADRCEIIGNRLRGSATHNVTDGLLVAAAVDAPVIAHNLMIFSATAANGNIRFSAAATNIAVMHNTCYNTHTSSTACIAFGNVAVNGVCAYNNVATVNDGTVTDQGVTHGAASLVRCFQNFSCDEPKKSGTLTPAAGT